LVRWPALICVIAALVLARPAHAQSLEEAGAAAAMIAEAGAADVFEPVDSALGEVRVRHVRSGLICAFEPGHPRRVVVFDTSVSGAAAGEDAACDSGSATGARTLYVTRYPEPRTADAALAFAVAQLRGRFPDATAAETTIEGFDDADPPLPESRTAAFLIETNNGQAYTRVSVAVIGGWEIKMRYTTWSGGEGVVAAEALWRETLAQFAAPAP
jgi:hypothetical protein